MANSLLRLTSRDLGMYEGSPVHKYFTEQCWKHMAQYTPGQESGELHNNVSLTTDTITYKSPYAHFLWYGELMVDSQTGLPYALKGHTKVYTGKPLRYHTGILTGAQWDSRMWTAEGDKIVEEVEEYIERRFL